MHALCCCPYRDTPSQVGFQRLRVSAMTTCERARPREGSRLPRICHFCEPCLNLFGHRRRAAQYHVASQMEGPTIAEAPPQPSPALITSILHVHPQVRALYSTEILEKAPLQNGLVDVKRQFLYTRP